MNKADTLRLCHRYQKSLNRLLKVCYVPATRAVLIAFFSSFLLPPLTVLMKQARQLVRAVKQSIYLDVYGLCPSSIMVEHLTHYPKIKGLNPTFWHMQIEKGKK